MSVAEEMRIQSRARRNHCDLMLDTHNPAEARTWRAMADDVDAWAVRVAMVEADLADAKDAMKRHGLLERFYDGVA